jgi:hypothetical protein
LAEKPCNRITMSDLCQYHVKKLEVLLKIIYLSASIYLLKRKLAIGIYIKVVAQILPVHLSGQRALNSIPTRRYTII